MVPLGSYAEQRRRLAGEHWGGGVGVAEAAVWARTRACGRRADVDTLAAKSRRSAKEAMASDLRQALRHTLSALQSQILVDSSRAVESHRARAHMAEMSSIRALLSLCMEALTGRQLAEDEDFIQPGAIRDSQDAASFAARELRLLREDAEAQVALPRAPPPKDAEAVLEAVLRAETDATSETERTERLHADMLETALGTCSREMCDTLCSALAEAAPRGTCTARRREIGAAATEKIQGIVQRWLEWFVRHEPSKQPPRAMVLPAEVTLLCVQDSEIGEYVRLLRRCMHLRRQHARLVSIMRRLGSAAKVCDACMVLRAKIVLPTQLQTSSSGAAAFARKEGASSLGEQTKTNAGAANASGSPNTVPSTATRGSASEASRCATAPQPTEAAMTRGA